MAAEESLVVKLEIEPGIRINADADLLLQTLHGLLENAARYAKSKILVSCRTEHHVAVLEIHNDRDPATIATPGLGLGLRLVRGICSSSAWQLEISETEHDFRAVIHFQTDSATGAPNS